MNITKETIILWKTLEKEIKKNIPNHIKNLLQ